MSLYSESGMQEMCRYFGECGGCTLQDQDYRAQLESKATRLHSLLVDRIAVGDCEWLPALSAEPWAYRYRARLSVRVRSKSDEVVIGFHHRRRTHEIVNLDQCPILASPLANLLRPLHSCLETLEAKSTIPQIDMVLAENGHALIIRHRQSLPDLDRTRLKAFASAHHTKIYLRGEGPESMRLLGDGEPFQPSYRLPEFDLTFHYPVTQFAQVSPVVNRMLVQSVIEQLAPQTDESIADLFCGAGNFALAAARSGAHVNGWEWSQGAVDCAKENAERNGLQKRVTFHRDDLDRASQEKCRRFLAFDKFVLDPPRSGAEALMHCLPSTGKRRVVYVSCQPKTLARDARILVHDKGYRLKAAGLIDMFPHTDHIEALAVFERP